MAASTVSSWFPRSLPESAAPIGLVLLDRCCHIADLTNNTTAESTTSRGLPIKVTFHAAGPPLVSHFCVHCPGLAYRIGGPKIVATDADLALLCVPNNPDCTSRGLDWDYFVYGPRARWLHRLPNPDPRVLDDPATALISHQDGASYVVAALGVGRPLYHRRALIRYDFDVHMYRSSDSQGWISKRLSVIEFQRDKLIPLPRAVDRLYHETEKTITIGGEHGTVAWVDLWRGIFFCDVLKECPVLQDVTLPEPARANWKGLLRDSNPSFLRDVTISRDKGLIKYVELELCSREELEPPVSYTSYIDWVHNYKPRKSVVFFDGWKSTTWNMAIPVRSGEGWHPDCVVDVKDVILEAGDPCLSDCIAMLSSNTTPTLKELPVAYPILSMDDDVVYLVSHTKPRGMDNVVVMLAIDVRKATLRGLAELDLQDFLPDFFTSEICRGT
ncbi:hypothetical protein Zm00014a_017377 [Zea mays]|uniref:DUF1618 domain-containing protein n=1 Tax=Zea mays TaxID=4577 RepID=A0A317Y730_MAIZE|nr:hypothetical protein Zm00014a_017377 [Zea mays]